MDRGIGMRAPLAIALSLAFLAVLPGSAIAASLNFFEPASSPEPVGAGPRAVAAADFDNDGDQDLAVADASAGAVTILKNRGNGSFFEPASSPVTGLDFPDAIVAADLDGDGDPDLAVANEGSGNVTILRNNGHGVFRQPASSPVAVGDSPTSVAASDLDGDADKDLAVTNSGSSTVTILKNHGNGTFFEPSSSPISAPTKPLGVGVGDFDRDGDRDLAVSEQQSSAVRIFLNNGAGKFTEAPTSPETTTSFPDAIAVAPLDGHAGLDLAVTQELTPTGEVSVLLNNGSGDFVQPASSPQTVGNFPTAIAAADFDRDTDFDLAVVNDLSSDVTILGNGGDGQFLEPASSPETVGAHPNGIAAADLDNDGDRDLAVPNTNGGSVTILKDK